MKEQRETMKEMLEKVGVEGALEKTEGMIGNLVAEVCLLIAAITFLSKKMFVTKCV